MGGITPGFHSEDHRRAFLEAGRSTQLGAPTAPLCGARTRGGGFCHRRPIEGFPRCLQHAGPKAAKVFHQRLFAAFGRGEIGLEEWQHRVHRRRVNKLPRIWTKDPWAPGASIDLGEFEDRFRGDLRLGGFDVDDLSPAALDRSRWKWRRLMLDGKRRNDWLVYLSGDLAARVRREGPRPEREESSTAIDALFRVGGVPLVGSKRRLLDMPRAEMPRPAVRRRRFRKGEMLSDEAVASLWLEHRDVLAKVAGDEADGETLRHVATTLTRHLADPDDVEAAEDWRRTVAEAARRR